MILNYIERLGEGAWGEVWLAEDLELKRHCAVKFFTKASPASQLAQASLHGIPLARIDHPCVVKIYATHEDNHPDTKESMYAIVMEYVPGTTLEKFEGKIDQMRASAIINDLISGVQAIHHAGIVHGDLWQRNVIITDRGAKIIDLFFERSLANRTATSANKALTNDIKDLVMLARQVLEHVEGIIPSSFAEAYYQAFTATTLEDVQRIFGRLLGQDIAPAVSEAALRAPTPETSQTTSINIRNAQQTPAAYGDPPDASQPSPEQDRGALLLKELASFNLKDLLTPTISELILTSPKEDLDRIIKAVEQYRKSGDAQRRSKRNSDLASPLLARLWKVAVVRKPYQADTVTYAASKLTVEKVYFDERWPREQRYMVEQLTRQPDVGTFLPGERLFFARKAPDMKMHLARGIVEAIYRLSWDTAAMQGSVDESFFGDWWPWGGVKLPEDIWSKLSEVIFWPAVRWRRFVDAEHLETSWNAAVARVRSYTERSKVERTWQFESLAHWYVRACLFLGNGTSIDEAVKVRPSRQDWEQVSELIRQQKKSHGEPYLSVPLEDFLSRLSHLTRLEDDLSIAARDALLQATRNNDEP